MIENNCENINIKNAYRQCLFFKKVKYFNYSNFSVPKQYIIEDNISFGEEITNKKNIIVI